MHLASDFDEAARRINVIAGEILRHCLDDGVLQPLTSKIIQGSLNQLAGHALAAEFLNDRKIGNAAFARLLIDLSCDITDYLAVALRDENSIWVRGEVVVNVPCLPPAPIVASQQA